MVEGADTMLAMIAGLASEVKLAIDKDEFEGADVLILKEKCDPYVGGGYYLMDQFENQKIGQLIWLCQVTDFVFGDIPPMIYYKREK